MKIKTHSMKYERQNATFKSDIFYRHCYESVAIEIKSDLSGACLRYCCY